MPGIRLNGRAYSGTATVVNADHLMYDNSTSGLTATNVQGAVDEVADKFSYKILVNGGINQTGTYTANANVNDITEVVFQYVYGSKVRQSVVYTGGQLRGGLCFPDIYLGGARTYMDISMSGTTITVSSYSADSLISTGYWGVMYR